MIKLKFNTKLKHNDINNKKFDQINLAFQYLLLIKSHNRKLLVIKKSYIFTIIDKLDQY